MLLKSLKALLVYLGDVFLDIRERVSHILFTPSSCVQQHIYDGLFLHQHLVCFVLDPLRNRSSLSKVDAMWWRFPVVLHRDPVRIADKDAAGVGRLHRISEHSSHVKVLRQLEDVTEVLLSGSLHSDGDRRLANLLNHVLEDVLYIF